MCWKQEGWLVVLPTGHIPRSSLWMGQDLSTAGTVQAQLRKRCAASAHPGIQPHMGQTEIAASVSEISQLYELKHTFLPSFKKDNSPLSKGRVWLSYSAILILMGFTLFALLDKPLLCGWKQKVCQELQNYVKNGGFWWEPLMMKLLLLHSWERGRSLSSALPFLCWHCSHCRAGTKMQWL